MSADGHFPHLLCFLDDGLDFVDQALAIPLLPTVFLGLYVKLLPNVFKVDPQHVIIQHFDLLEPRLNGLL